MLASLSGASHLRSARDSGGTVRPKRAEPGLTAGGSCWAVHPAVILSLPPEGDRAPARLARCRKARPPVVTPGPAAHRVEDLGLPPPRVRRRPRPEAPGLFIET
jgi:hypothetical protein